MLILFITLFSCFSFLFPQGNIDLERGLVYPEDHEIKYFDPYLLHSEIEDGKDVQYNNSGTLQRLSAFLHETLFENDGELYTNFLPKDKYFKVVDGGEKAIIELPVEESYWKFHNDRRVEIKDIFYSIKYAIEINMFLPHIYKNKNKVKMIFEEDKERIIFEFDKPYPAPNIKKHFKDLIILPFEHTKEFVDQNFNKQSDGFNVLNEWVKKEGQDITHIVSAGPFKVNSLQNLNDGSVLLAKFNDYPQKSLGGNIEQIKIKAQELKTKWYEYLIKGDYNIIPELLNIPSFHTTCKYSSRPSTKITSLIINYDSKKSKQLEDKDFRKALTYLLDKNSIRRKILQRKAELLNGPFISSDSGYMGDEDSIAPYQYNPKEFKKIMEEELGYELQNHPGINKLIYRKKDTGEWAEFKLLYSTDQKHPASEMAICNIIIEDFQSAGIYLKHHSKSTKKNFDTAIMNSDFDFLYLVNTVQSGESIEKYYGKNGRKNYGRYKPSDQLQNLLDRCDEKCHSADIASSLRPQIYTIIANDYANLFLWSPESFYAYNTDYIKVKKKAVLMTEEFFRLPHRSNFWKMNEKDE